jgi:hypothetical protein
MTLKQPESVSDFKARIALLMRERLTGHKYSVIGAPPPPEWCRKRKNNKQER